jgi:hypothetical protein
MGPRIKQTFGSGADTSTPEVAANVPPAPPPPPPDWRPNHSTSLQQRATSPPVAQAAPAQTDGG